MAKLLITAVVSAYVDVKEDCDALPLLDAATEVMKRALLQMDDALSFHDQLLTEVPANDPDRNVRVTIERHA